MQVRVKRVYEAPSSDDGMRVLVDRLWPRGVKKEALAADLWAKGLAPSAAARKAFGHKAENFEDFKARYLSELDSSDEADKLVHEIAQGADGGVVTLLYAAKDPKVNHAVILRDWLADRLG